MATSRDLGVLETANTALSFRRAGTEVRRRVRGVCNFRVLEQRCMFIIRNRLSVKVLVRRVVYTATGLRANTAINKNVRLIRQRVTFTQCHRARDTVTRRLSAGRLTVATASVLVSGDTVSFHRLLRVGLAHRRRRVNGLHVRARYLSVKSVRLHARVRLGALLCNVLRRHRVNNCSDVSPNYLNVIRGLTRRLRVLIMSSNVSYGVYFGAVLAA